MRSILFFYAAVVVFTLCAAPSACRAEDTATGGMHADDILQQLRAGSAHRAVKYFDSLPESTEITLAMKRVMAPRLRMTGDFGRARRLFEEILAETPNDESAMRGLAMTLFDVGDYESAQRLLFQLAAGDLDDGVKLPQAVTDALGPEAVADVPEPEPTNRIVVSAAPPDVPPEVVTTGVVEITSLAPTCEVAVAVPVTTVIPEPVLPRTQAVVIVTAEVAAVTGEVAVATNTVPEAVPEEAPRKPVTPADHLAMLIASNKISAAFAYHELLSKETELPSALRRLLATAYAEDGKCAQAARVYAALFDEDPTDSETGLAMVTLYGECDRDAALAAADKVLEHHPEDTSLLLAKAEIELSGENRDAALALGERVLELDATNEPARELCFDILVAKARTGEEGSNAFYEQALAIENSPDIRNEYVDVLYRQGRTQEVITAYEAFPEMADRPVGLLWTMAQLYTAQDNADAAIDAYEALLGNATNAPAVYPAYVELLLAEGRTQEVQRVLGIYPDGVKRPLALLAMTARFYDDTGDDDKALAAYREWFAAEPDRTDAGMRLAEILAERQAYDEALAVTDRVLAVDTSSVAAVRQQVLINAEKGAHAAVAAACGRLRELGADDEESVRLEREALRAVVQGKSGEEAAALYARLIDLGETDGKVLLGQAELLVELGRVKEAAAVFARLDPACDASQTLLRAVGEFYRSKQEFDKAIPVYRTLVKKNPDDAELKRALVVLYFDKGDFKSAAEVLDGPDGAGTTLPPDGDDDTSEPAP